jgi:hypothetical protein
MRHSGGCSRLGLPIFMRIKDGIAALGIALNVVGAALLYRSTPTLAPALSYYYPDPGTPQYSELQRSTRRFNRMARGGFLLLVLGSLLQLAAMLSDAFDLI